MLKDVVSVEVLDGYRLRLEFDDGIRGEVVVSDLVDLKGVFEPLRRREYFKRVRVDPEVGTICWPNGADLDPLVLYSRVTQKPIVFHQPAMS